MTQYNFKNKIYKKNLLRQEFGFNIKVFLIVFSIALLIFYGLFNARSIILGPSIDVYTPKTNSETTENTLIIKGKAKNATLISLNQRPISIDKNGLFEEKLLLSPGSNIIEIKVRDRFKNEVSKTLKVYLVNSSNTIETIQNLD